MKSPLPNRFARSGLAFSLVELLVVIGIIALLAALLLPTLGKAKESGRGAACLNNLRQIGIVLNIWINEHDNKLPELYDPLINLTAVATNVASLTNKITVDQLLTNDLDSKQVFRCPSDRKALFEQTGSSYSWNVLVNGQNVDQLKVMSVAIPADQAPIMFDKEPFHFLRGPTKAYNFLYASGQSRSELFLEGFALPQ